MKKEVKNWLDSAQYDLETAEHMYNTGRYIYTVFMCHLALEKVLKAKLQEVSGKTPPKTHNLIYLIKLSSISLDEQMLQFIGDINTISVPTRYPKDFQAMYKDFSQERTKKILDKSKETFKWIKGLLNP